MIKGAQGVAVAAAIGNLLQGWDGGAIAGTCPVCEQALPHALILLGSHHCSYDHSSTQNAAICEQCTRDLKQLLAPTAAVASGSLH